VPCTAARERAAETTPMSPAPPSRRLPLPWLLLLLLTLPQGDGSDELPTKPTVQYTELSRCSAAQHRTVGPPQ
jgi:hypothetical protein